VEVEVRKPPLEIIEFLTENGFSIVRRWEADGGPAPVDGQFSFLVRNPQDLESEVTVKVGRLNGQVIQIAPDSPEGQSAKRALESLRAAHNTPGKPGA